MDPDFQTLWDINDQFSVVACYKLGLRQSLDSLFRKQGNLFLDHGGLARCESIISRSYLCSCRPF